MRAIKSIFKEICIMILLCVAIVLVLGVIFYDSLPQNKVVPNKLEAYKTNQEVENEINEEVAAMNKVEVTYEIKGSDLTLYKQTNSYKPGKPDPFSASTSTNTSNPSGGSVNNNGNNAGGNATTDPNSTGTFFNNTGHK
ncbi:MAG: hypothetical protein HFJ32_03775 [Clostridia bacterium]|nr:hypothetical protein [Clostridia bacterium]